MKGKMFSKSKLVAIICCLCLALTSLVSASFLFNKNEKVLASEGNVGYYVQDGASVRFDDRISGLRYETVVTKEQYDAWTDVYGAEATFEFHTVISFATPGEEKVDVTCVGDITAHDFNAGDFVYKAAKFFDLTDNGEGEDWTDEELFEIYNSQWKAESYVLINGQRVDADSANNLRSMRSVALLNRIKETTSDAGELALLKEFTQNVSAGEFVELNDEDIITNTDAYYYNNYADASNGITFELPGALPAGNVGAFVGANAIGETDAILSNERDSITVKNAKEFLSVGESEYFVLDANVLNKVFVMSNVIDATEVFFASNGVERMKEVFTINGAETFVNSKIERDAVINEFDEEKTSEFYNVDRGYYVLGEDIDFAGEYIHHDSNVIESKNYYSNDPNLNNAPEGFYRNTTVSYMSGQFGFGGTFNGNGHAIKGFNAISMGPCTEGSKNYYSTRVSGLFGALAYGAKIENVAFTGTSYGGRGDANLGSHAVLATWAGKSDDDAYLSAKYGEEPAIVIDNCYFDFDKTNYTTADIGTSSNINNARSPQGRGIIIQTGEGVSQFSNCVFQTYNSEPFGVYTSSDGGYGIIADSRTKIFDENFENCFMISAPKANGRVEPIYQLLNPYVYNYTTEEYEILNNRTVNEVAKVPDSGTYDKNAHPFIYMPESAREIYAANDAQKFGITNGDEYAGTQIYTGVVDGEYAVAIPDSVNGYTANKTALAYSNLYRYDNYVDMIINNQASLEGFNTDFWNVEGGAVIWNGVNDGNDYSSVTLNVGYTGDVEVGTPVQLTVTMFGQDVTASATIATGNGYTVDNDAKTVTLTENASVMVNVTLGEYSGSVVLATTEDYDQAIVTSSAYSAVKGETETYSVPYKLVDGNLVATDLVEIYRTAVGNNGATLTGAYLMDNGQVQLDVVEVEDKSFVALADPGRTPTLSSVALHGSHGVILLTNNTVVTAVVEDEYGFDYINNDATTMAGSYYLAKDFDDRIDETSAWDATTNSKTSEIILYNGADYGIGYSFGYTPSLNALNAGELAFHGLFDGLGHTINYMRVEKHGLMGIYNVWQDTGAILRNVKFDNLSVSSVYKNGTFDETTGKPNGAVSYAGYMVLGMSTYKAANTDVQTAHRVYIENVIINLNSGLSANVEIVGHRGSAVMNNLIQGKFDFTDVIINMPVTGGSSNSSVYQGGNNGGSAFVFGLGTGTVDAGFASRLTAGQGANTDNFVVINAPHPGTKRIPTVTGTRDGKVAAYLALYANDFAKYLGEGNKSTIGNYVVTTTANETLTSASVQTITSSAGWGEVELADGTNTFLIVPNVDSLADGATWVKRHATNTHSDMANTATSTTPPTIFIKMDNMYRYDTYADYVGEAENVRHGSWLVNADGTAVWSPIA